MQYACGPFGYLRRNGWCSVSAAVYNCLRLHINLEDSKCISKAVVQTFPAVVGLLVCDSFSQSVRLASLSSCVLNYISCNCTVVARDHLSSGLYNTSNLPFDCSRSSYSACDSSCLRRQYEVACGWAAWENSSRTNC